MILKDIKGYIGTYRTLNGGFAKLLACSLAIVLILVSLRVLLQDSKFIKVSITNCTKIFIFVLIVVSFSRINKLLDPFGFINFIHV